MSSERIRIAVIGAGIAGLTAAAALARAGLRCQVFEQAELLREVGAGVQLAPNAVRLLHRLGLRDQLSTVAVPVRALEMRRWDDNSVLRKTPLEGCEQRFGAPYYTVHRADLHRCLLERAGEGIVHLGLRCTGLTERPDGVALQFADGSTVTADVVIGADGVHSRIREHVIRDEARFSGQSIYRALIPADRVALPAGEPSVVIWLGPGRHCVSYPVSRCDYINLAATTPDPRAGVESWSASGRVEDLAETYADWNCEVRALTSAPDVVSRWALHDREPLPEWSTARVTLAGDAAHPMLPFLAQGANQAIEDAVALAACLRDAAGIGGRGNGASGIGASGIGAALARYDRIRVPRTREVQRVSRANTVALHLPDGDEQRSRDDALAAAAALEHHDWLYSYDAEAAVVS